MPIAKPQSKPTLSELLQKFPDLLTLARGDGNFHVARLNSFAEANPEDLIFVGSSQYLKEAISSRALSWVVPPALQPEVPTQVANLLICPNPTLAMALTAKVFFPVTAHLVPVNSEPIHPSAQIAESAKLGVGCVVGPGAVIGNNVEIGDHCVIGANSVLEPGVSVGSYTHIHPLVFIAHGCQIGAECEILPNTTLGSEGFGYAQDRQFQHSRITHYGRVVLEDRVHIGAGVQIDRGTFLDSRIGAGTKIDNHCHFGHNIQIGRNVLITGGMITAGSVTIGNNCVFGGRTTIKGHLSICDGVRTGGLSAISKSITKPGEYGGFPLQEISAEMRVRASIPKIPEMSRQIRRILKHLGLEP